MYELRFANGCKPTFFLTEAAALVAFFSRYPHGTAGHDGDLSEGGDRTLCWASEEDSKNDDGAKAAATIYAVRSDD